MHGRRRKTTLAKEREASTRQNISQVKGLQIRSSIRLNRGRKCILGSEIVKRSIGRKEKRKKKDYFSVHCVRHTKRELTPDGSWRAAVKSRNCLPLSLYVSKANQPTNQQVSKSPFHAFFIRGIPPPPPPPYSVGRKRKILLFFLFLFRQQTSKLDLHLSIVFMLLCYCYGTYPLIISTAFFSQKMMNFLEKATIPKRKKWSFISVVQC